MVSKAKLGRIATDFEDDRNSRGRVFCGNGCRCGGRHNDSDLTMNQIGHQRGQPIDLVLRPPVFDRHVAAFNVTGFA
jgi:hypothetical protein